MKPLVAGKSLFVIILLVLGCSSQAAKKFPPAWVLNPIGDGIAATGCTRWSGSMSLDRQIAVANARIVLAQRIEISITAVNKLLSSKTGNNKVKSSFESVSEQRTDQVLRSAATTRVEVVKFNRKNQLCATVELGTKVTKRLFINVVKTSSATLSIQEEAELYTTFANVN